MTPNEKYEKAKKVIADIGLGNAFLYALDYMDDESFNEFIKACNRITEYAGRYTQGTNCI
mgnify:CR=1 FL=1